jgi:hypothetical protein
MGIFNKENAGIGILTFSSSAKLDTKNNPKKKNMLSSDNTTRLGIRIFIRLPT